MMEGKRDLLDLRDRESRELDDRILTFVASNEHTELGFERLALNVFAYQYERNDAYRRYCDRFGRRPADVRHWLDIPAVPTAAFAAARLACFPTEAAVLKFESSGTTTAGAAPSAVDLDCGALYDESLITHFKARVLPDSTPVRLVALAPSRDEAPHSSLSYMIERIADRLCAPDGGFFVHDGALNFDAAVAELQRGPDPIIVFGTAFAFVHFFDECKTRGIRLSLPIGSRVVETGGFKGKSREVPREQLYADFGNFLGVPRVLCASEYGMCELASQWYDANIDDYFSGREPRVFVKVGPHWAKAVIVDPVTATPVAKGQAGLIQLFDLCNRGSVAAVLTLDVGRERDGGFELLGRAAGAPPKGCSIAIDALLRRSDD